MACRQRTLLLSALLIFGAACTNPVSVERHARVDGFALIIAGDTVVTGERTASDGTVELVAGQTQGPASFEFLRRGDYGVPEGDYFLEVIFGEDGIAAFEADAVGAFTGELRGLSAGSTTLRVRLMHGRPGSIRAHSDFDSPLVPVVVSGED